VVAITIAKYRKAHQLLQEAEAGQSQVRTQTIVQQGGSKADRSMSVTREITRVVRV
jgi:DNA-binding XRE family transcriptional regulator